MASATLTEPTAPAAPERVDGGYTFRLVALFGIGWVVLMASILMFNPLLPLIRAEFQLSGTQAGTLAGALYLPYLLMQVPAGLLADRLGAKRVLIAMTLLSAITLAAAGLLAFSLLPLVIFGVVSRVGNGVYYPAAFGMTVNTVPRALRGVSSSVLSGGMALGSGVGLALAVPLVELGGSWRFPFLVAGIATFLLALAFWGLLRSGQRISHVAAGGLGMALRDPWCWLIFGLGLCTNFGFIALATWGPSFFSAERGMTLAEAGFYTSLLGFIGVPAGLVLGRLSDRADRRRLVVTMFALATIFLAAVATLTDPLLILLALVAYGVTGKWATDGITVAWIGDHVSTRYPAATASVLGFSNMSRMIGATISPIVAGALLDLTGSLQAGLYAGVVAVGVGAVLAALARDEGDGQPLQAPGRRAA